MHISSSSASVSEFDASKLIFYWKSMSHERLICLATLSHQFTFHASKLVVYWKSMSHERLIDGNPFPSIYNVNERELALQQGKVVEESSLFITVNKKMLLRKCENPPTDTP